ncbi:MAG: cation:proton antiporter [Planctomycetales bacterium]
MPLTPADDRRLPAGRRRTLIAYAAMTLAAALIYGMITVYGNGLNPLTEPFQSESREPSGSSRSDVLRHVLVALAAVIVTGRIVGGLFRYLGQPPVIGEVLAGIVLGPSLLGRISPELSTWLLPPSVAPHLGVLAQVGVILYMFLVGLELDIDELRRHGASTAAISHASIVAPFLLGGALALALYPRYSSGVPFSVFALFLGVAMSVTAFPVLARILTDHGLNRTHLGTVALASAAIDDATAWCLLAFVVGVAQSEMGGAVQVVGLALGYLMIMFLVVRPALLRLAPRIIHGQPDRAALAVVLLGLLLSAIATELIGVHALFGAFVFGAVIPHDSGLARDLTRKLEDFVAVLLLPAFFAFAGMRTQIGLVSGWENWLWCGAIILVATVGKFGGTVAAARFTGLGWRDASSLGILMNTRGLMELIVLNIGLDLGVISPTLFAMMVIMALVTTIATTPILCLIWPAARQGNTSHAAD